VNWVDDSGVSQDQISPLSRLRFTPNLSAPELLYRRDLIRRINQGEHQITYLYSPSGYGKSVLTAQWAEEQDLPIAWFVGSRSESLGELLENMIKSITLALPGLKKPLEKFLERDSFGPEAVIELGKLIGETKNEFVLVIESAEEISLAHEEASINFIAHLPQNVKAILLRRSLPTLPTLYKIGFDKFLVLTPEDLKFTKTEISQLSASMSLSLTEPEIKSIEEMTNGWPAAIHLLLNTIRESEPGEFSWKFEGDQEDQKIKFSILAQRALCTLLPERLEFLTSLAFMEEISVHSAVAITENPDSIQILTRLSGESLFLRQTKDSPATFRINPLIQLELQNQVLLDTQLSKKVIEKTVGYLLSHDEVHAALTILTKTGSTDALKELMETPGFLTQIDDQIRAAIYQSRPEAIRRWRDFTPFYDSERDVSMELVDFFASWVEGDLAAAEAKVKKIHKSSEVNPKDLTLASRSHFISTLLAFSKGELRSALAHAFKVQEIAEKLLTDTGYSTAAHLRIAAWAAVLLDDNQAVKKVSSLLDRVSANFSGKAFDFTIPAARCIIAAHEGRLTESLNVYQPTQAEAKIIGARGVFGLHDLRFAKVNIDLESGDYQSALELSRLGLDEALESHCYGWVIAFYCRISNIYNQMGERELALSYIGKARDFLLTKSLPTDLHRIVDRNELIIRYEQEDHQRVKDLLARLPRTYRIIATEAGRAVVHGSPKAEQILRELDLQIPREALAFYLFSAYGEQKSPEQKQKLIKAALDIGSVHGYFNTFLRYPASFYSHYISLANQYPSAYLERLSRTAGERMSRAMSTSSELNEPLTRREADILRHLSTGLPIKEIAANLSISRNTIKTHLRNLYRKLGAGDRNDAVEKGKALLKV